MKTHFLQMKYRGMLLGTAVGDSVGLPSEGMTRLRASRMFQGPWRHRFLFGHGMISDDTEHSLFVAQCLLAYPESQDQFGRRLGFCLKWWFISLPAGIGLATARACIKLCLGFNWRKSGVFSAGNGPAMRAAPLGAFFADNPRQLAAYLQASTTITHTDPKSLIGATAIAETAARIVRENLQVCPPINTFCEMLAGLGTNDTEWTNIVSKLRLHLNRGASVTEFAAALGQEKEVSGYMYHTVPVVLYAWHRHFGDYRATLSAVLDCGGDTDTTGAIVGALAGLTVGESGIPPEWINGISEWPRSVSLCRRIANRLAEQKQSCKPAGPIWYFWPGTVPRNIVFLIIVLCHGFRRLW